MNVSQFPALLIWIVDDWWAPFCSSHHGHGVLLCPESGSHTGMSQDLLSHLNCWWTSIIDLNQIQLLSALNSTSMIWIPKNKNMPIRSFATRVCGYARHANSTIIFEDPEVPKLVEDGFLHGETRDCVTVETVVDHPTSINKIQKYTHRHTLSFPLSHLLYNI